MWNSNQLMNFCNHVFDSGVTSDTICCEGYDVTNLVSDDIQKRNRGFLSDRFIKPPVEVVLKFPFEISISHIQIITQVGQQKSSAVEVYSSFTPNSRDHKLKDSGVSIMEKVGFVNIDSAERGVIFFCPQLHGRQWTHPEADKMKMKAFTWIQRGAIIHSSKLTLRIVRTSGSSIPGIGSIEVWGVPSPRLLRPKIDEVKKLWKSTQEPRDYKIMEVPVEEQDTKVKTRCVVHDAHVIDQVPEDFLDAITYEVMALPMVLPSGKIVDQRSLERHAAAEALWGRPPSDPFTGIFFKSGCQPVLDVVLKGQIDRFLVLNQNREDLKMVPRTVGRVCSSSLKAHHSHASVSALGISSLLNSSKKIGSKRLVHGESYTASKPSGLINSCKRIGSKRLAQSDSNSADMPSAFTLLPAKVSETVTKAEATSRESESSAVKKAKHHEGLCELPKNLSFEDCSDVQCLSSPVKVIDIDDPLNIVDNSRSHEEKLDRSLQFAIKAALSGLPSFVNPIVPKQNIKSCSSCNETRNLFSLPCDHYICRNCLIGVTKQANSACPDCNIAFKSSDPVRCHD